MPQFKSYLQAGYPALYVQTVEPSRAQDDLSCQVLEVKGAPIMWDLLRGIRNVKTGERIEECPDSLSALSWLSGAPENTVLFVWNFHKFLSELDAIQAIQNGIDDWKAEGKCLVALAPRVQIPLELERLFTVIDFELPDREDHRKILAEVASSAGSPLPDHAEALLDAAVGLTTFEAENAFALSAIDPKPFSCEVVSAQKAQMVKKNALIDIFYSAERFERLGGMENLKDFCLKIGLSPLSRGVLLLGIQGCGKSQFAKALGGELSVPTLSLDFGRIFGSLVGESEERIRQALAVADAMAPCVLMIDEIEKGLGGARAPPMSWMAAYPRISWGRFSRGSTIIKAGSLSSRPPIRFPASRRNCCARSAGTRSSSSIFRLKRKERPF